MKLEQEKEIDGDGFIFYSIEVFELAIQAAF